MGFLPLAALGGIVRWGFFAGGGFHFSDGVVGVIGVFGGVESLFQRAVFGAVVFIGVAVVATAVLVAVFMALGVDGGDVRTSIGDFSASFAGRKSGLVVGSHLGNLGKACGLFCGI